MKKLQLIDIPKKVSLKDYDDAIDRMLYILESYDQIKTVYQVGSVKTPGISDIDLLVIFENESSLKENPRNRLTEEDKYLFSHDLFGVSIDKWPLIEKYNLYGNYKLLKGEELPIKKVDDNPILNQQLAIEYLLKAYVSLTLDLEYGILKLRNFLLHIKGIKLDLKLLNLEDKVLDSYVTEVINMRENWFNKRFSNKEITYLAYDLHRHLELFLGKYFSNRQIYFPRNYSGDLYRNIKIENGSFSFKRKGKLYPKPLRLFVKSKKAYNLLNRLNHFSFKVPYCSDQNVEIENKIKYYQDYWKENQKNYPSFGVSGNVLNLYSS